MCGGCEQLGESDLALNAVQNAGRFSGGDSKVIELCHLFARLGRSDEARNVLNTWKLSRASGTFHLTRWRSCTLGSPTR
jgi:hypothetical protein